jgi:DNA-binding CsgD family transcriptional regulator
MSLRFEKLEKKYSKQQIAELREENKKLLVDLKGQLTQLIQSKPSDNDLVSFFSNFEKIYPSFVSSMQRMIPEITSNEVRLSILLRINLSSKEIAHLLSITQESVNKARYRLRKKIGLTTSDDIYTFLLNL